MTKRDPKAFATNEIIDDAVDTLLKGIDNMLVEQKKIFATKEDLKNVREDMKSLATKEDLKREVGWLKDDIKGLTADLSGLPTKVDKYLAS